MACFDRERHLWQSVLDELHKSCTWCNITPLKVLIYYFYLHTTTLVFLPKKWFNVTDTLLWNYISSQLASDSRLGRLGCRYKNTNLQPVSSPLTSLQRYKVYNWHPNKLKRHTNHICDSVYCSQASDLLWISLLRENDIMTGSLDWFKSTKVWSEERFD